MLSVHIKGGHFKHQQQETGELLPQTDDTALQHNLPQVFKEKQTRRLGFHVNRAINQAYGSILSKGCFSPPTPSPAPQVVDTPRGLWHPRGYTLKHRSRLEHKIYHTYVFWDKTVLVMFQVLHVSIGVFLEANFPPCVFLAKCIYEKSRTQKHPTPNQWCRTTKTTSSLYPIVRTPAIRSV